MENENIPAENDEQKPLDTSPPQGATTPQENVNLSPSTPRENMVK